MELIQEEDCIDIEKAREIIDEALSARFYEWMDPELHEAKFGYISGMVPSNPRIFHKPVVGDWIHGGVIYTAIDMVAPLVTVTTLPSEDYNFVLADMDTNLQNLADDDLYVEGKLVESTYATRKIHVTVKQEKPELDDEDDSEDIDENEMTTIAEADVTYLVTKKDPREL